MLATGLTTVTLKQVPASSATVRLPHAQVLSLPVSPSPYLSVSPSPHLPISPSPHLPISPSLSHTHTHSLQLCSDMSS